MSEYPTHRPPYFPTHAIRDLRHPAIRCEEKAIFFAMADRQQGPGDLITASLGTIADDAGVSRKTAQRVVSWAVSVGVVSGHVRDGFRCYGFHLDKLLGLPAACVRDKLRAGPAVPSSGPAVPAMGPADQGEHGESMGPAVPTMGPAVPVQCPPVPCSVSAGPPKGQSRTKQRGNQGPNSAGVPPRVEWSSGQRLAFCFANPDPPTPSTNAATPGHPPEPSDASVESLPVNDSTPPPKGKGKGKAGKKPVRKLTDEQLAARDTVYAFWKKTYLDELGVEPIVGNIEVGQMVQLLKKVQWNSATVCALIKNAFADAFFRERIKTIGNITANPSKYQTAPKSERRSSGQVDPSDDFFTNRDNDLAGEFGL